jgi:hypothetical protein
MLVKPSRLRYGVKDLGLPFMRLQDKSVRRVDFSVTNCRLQQIQASLFSYPD